MRRIGRTKENPWPVNCKGGGVETGLSTNWTLYGKRGYREREIVKGDEGRGMMGKAIKNEDNCTWIYSKD